MTIPTTPIHHGHLQTLTDTIAFHATRTPDAVAVRRDGHDMSYDELRRGGDATAWALLADGRRPGDRIAYLGQESEHYFEVLVACARTGTVLVPINWRLTADEIRHILRDSGSRTVFVESAYRPRVDELRAELPELSTVVVLDDPDGFSAWKAAAQACVLGPGSGPEDPLAQLYTSGTTGLPKGVVLAQRSFFRIRDALAGGGLDWIDWRPGDVVMLGIPSFHIGGLWCAVQGFAAGVTLAIMRTWVARDALQLIREGVTVGCMVPAMLQMLLAEPGMSPADFRTLRKVIYGGSPISEPLLRRCIEVLDCEFAQIYGLTETGNTAVCLPPDQHLPGSTRLQAAGRPYPGVTLKVIDENGVPLPPGSIGEICIHTPAAMVEYWNRPDATAETLVNGWIHTGDAGYLDDEGYVFIRDRIKDVIIVAGENVFPAEIERVLVTHPAVADAAVIGVPDERWGEAAHACVVLHPGAIATPRELRGHLIGRIADFKVPVSYEIRETLPRNPSGKVLRRVLRDSYWAGRSRQVN
jgi:acyl-CoA synthetase (AMP-forming)/AMP-acid ligase II